MQKSWLGIAMLILVFAMTSCHGKRKIQATPGHRDVEVVIKSGEIRSGDKLHRRVAEEARTWIGTPYAYACSEKGVGTDCSGMVMRIYEDVAGKKLPRNSAKQADFCNSLRSNEVEVGDLVFFATGKDPEKVSHVGIMLDAENFIHASGSKGVVISKISTNYYQSRFIKFGRVP